MGNGFRTTQKKSIEDYETSSGDAKEAARRNIAYFAVALSLLEPETEQVANGDIYTKENIEKFSFEEADKYLFEIPQIVKDDVEAELALIENHEGFALSPIFSYKEDYSQYIPRGHYTHSEKLKKIILELSCGMAAWACYLKTIS